MLLWLLQTTCSGLYYAALDLVSYTLVDLVAKSFLKESQSDEEKRHVWLSESLTLAILCAALYGFSHRPFILGILTLLTCIYTQMVGRVDFGYWWNQVTTRWDEFQSMEQLQESTAQQLTGPALQEAQMASLAAWQQQQMAFWEGELPAEPWYPDEDKKIPNNTAGHDPSSSVPSQPASAGASQPTVTTGPTVMKSSNSIPAVGQPIQLGVGIQPRSTQIQPVYTQPMLQANANKQYLNNVLSSRGGLAVGKAGSLGPSMQSSSQSTPQINRRSNFARRGLHSYIKANNVFPAPEQGAFKTRLMSALGFGNKRKVPPGMRNNGQNLCFMNSVLQCLAHGPEMCDDLFVDKNSYSREAALLATFRELMMVLSADPEETGAAIAESFKFRQAASCFPNSVVAHPSRGIQEQQDVAEFLMWLLDTLHTILNKTDSDSDGRLGQTFEPQRNEGPVYNSMTLTILKFIYGDLNPNKIQELKKTFKQEIEYSSSLSNETCDESIQRLADLEWLTYKERNNSVINNLFTGQLVEAVRCMACDHISVTVQTFNILPVPIVKPNVKSGLVFLEDCFDKFGTVENLYGPNGLTCDKCQVRTPGSSLSNHGGHVMNAAYGTPVMSPIPKYRDKFDDSGFQDNQHKTSTPIRSYSTSKVTDGQRRTLLRQVPECLVVQLMRFSCENGQIKKVHWRVSIPLVNFDLSRNTYQEGIGAQQGKLTYNLYALCVHTGASNTSFGHYVTYALARNGVWYKFEDESVTEVNMEYLLRTEELRENAYLLFYRRTT